ncbi:MAG TPA: winged helix DNA-binding domain-containing protein [Acidimicrobiales bacterium]|nr:winged helix DNA-binding domain-containing protein [Acidimicrobiales bacterium]
MGLGPPPAPGPVKEPAARLTWHEVDARRLAINHLTVPAPPDDLVGVVSRACGIQAQVMSAAELALSARIPALRTADVRAALWEHRTLVKTFGPRGTIHLLAADDVSLYMSAMRAHPYWRGDALITALGLQSSLAGTVDAEHRGGAALVEAFADALDGRRLTRDELATEVARRLGPWIEEPLRSNWGTLLRPAAFAGVLCFGPSVGSRVTFVRADQWLDQGSGRRPAPAVDSDAALAELIRRFLAAYAPTSEPEIAAWLGLAPAEVRSLLDALGPEMEPVEIEGDGRPRWRLAAARGPEAGSDPTTWPPPRPTLALLPQYDSYVLGHRQRDRLVPPAAKARIARDPKGRLEHVVGVSVLLVDGVVGGLWWRATKARRLQVTVEPTTTLEPSHLRLLDAEVERVAAFLGVDGAALVFADQG